MNTTRLVGVIFAALVTLGVAACGGHDDDATDRLSDNLHCQLVTQINGTFSREADECWSEYDR